MASDQDEIDQIMNEIEELQQEMSSPAAAPTVEESDRSLHEFVTVEEPAASAGAATATEVSVPEVSAAASAPMEEPPLTEAPDEETWVEETIAELRRADQNIAPAHTASSGSSSTGRVTLGVTPGVGVCLKQESSGQELVVEFEEDCVRITTSDGAELKLPVISRSQGLRRVA